MSRDLKHRLISLAVAFMAVVLMVVDLIAFPRIEAANAAGGGTFYQTLSYATGRTPSYSGNIGSIDWCGNDGIGRRYGFTYDGLGRLTSAAYSETVKRPAANVASGTVSYSTAYTYGPDSRPLTVTRQGVRSFIKSLNSTTVPVFGEVDNLTFTYSGSRLIKVSDTVGSLIYAGASDFDDGADTATEYTYDEDGRMISDANKGITSIKYNALGLPAEVTFSDGCSITNRYGADGTLLQRVKAEPLKQIVLAAAATPSITLRTTKTTDNHIGALTLRGNALLRIDTPTGYFAAAKMHYYVKDYQGNVRQVTDADGNVEQDNHYYPYGMLMAESSDILATARGGNVINPNPYLYGSKEYLTTGTANLLDFTARTYDPSTILFQTQDPMASKNTWLNPYTYCGSDPVNFIDPDGRDLVATVDSIPYKWEFRTGIGWGFYSGNGTEYSGNDMFMINLTKSLRTLVSRPVGLKLVKSIVDSKKITTIKNGENLAGDYSTLYEPSDNTIYIDYANPTGAKVEDGVDYNTDMALAHELVHSRLGKNQMGIWEIEVDGEILKVNNSEKLAVHYENMIRAEHCLPLRTYYTWDNSGSGCGQFIKSGTRMSIYYKFPSLPNGRTIPYHYFRYLKRH